MPNKKNRRKNQKQSGRDRKQIEGARAKATVAAKGFSGADKAITWVMLVFMSIQPIAFRLMRLDFVAPGILNTSVTDTGVLYDTYTQLKMILLYIVAGMLLLMFIYKIVSEGYIARLTAFDALLGALCLILALSVLMSDMKSVALNGLMYMRDGALPHIAFCFMFFLGYHVLSRYSKPNQLFVPLCIIGGVNALVSLLNFLGVDMVAIGVVRFLLGMPPGARPAEGAGFASTLGNVNYLSGFAGVMFAIFFARLLFVAGIDYKGSRAKGQDNATKAGRAKEQDNATKTGRAKGQDNATKTGKAKEQDNATKAGKGIVPSFIDKNGEAIASFAMTAVSFLMVITSLSSSGFYTFIVMFFIISAIALINAPIKKVVLLIVSNAVVCGAIFAILAGQNPQVYTKTLGRVESAFEGGIVTVGSVQGAGATATATATASVELQSTKAAQPPEEAAIVPIVLQPPEAAAMAPIELQSVEAAMAPLASQPVVSAIKPIAAQSTVAVMAPIAAQLPEDAAVRMDGPIVLPTMPEPGLAPATGRFYIWRETAKLIVKRPFFGYGMDTITYNFPQSDPQKIANLGELYVMVTKPHNVYLSYAYGAGISALIVFLAINALGLVALIRYIYRRKKEGMPFDPVAMCFMAGWAAYLIQALVNDDSIAVAHIWWALFGIAAALIINCLPNGSAGGLKTTPGKPESQ